MKQLNVDANLVIALVLGLGGAVFCVVMYGMRMDEKREEREEAARQRTVEEARRQQLRIEDEAERERRRQEREAEREADRAKLEANRKADLLKRARILKERRLKEAEKIGAVRQLAEEKRKRFAAEAAVRAATRDSMYEQSRRERVEDLNAPDVSEEVDRDQNAAEAKQKLPSLVRELSAAEGELEKLSGARNAWVQRLKSATQERTQSRQAAVNICKNLAALYNLKYSGGPPWDCYPDLIRKAQRKHPSGVVVKAANRQEEMDRLKRRYDSASVTMTKWRQKAQPTLEKHREVSERVHQLKAVIARLKPLAEDAKLNEALQPKPISGWIFKLKDGKQLMAVKYVDFGEDYSLKLTSGRFKKVSKKDVVEIIVFRQE